MKRIARRNQCLDGAARREAALWIVWSNHFVNLHQIDDVDLEPLHRLLELPARRCRRPPVQLGHHECFLPIPVAQRFPGASFTLSAVVVPAVVEEVDATVDGGANQLDAILFVFRDSNVIAAQANGRDALAGAAQRAIGYISGSRLRAGWNSGCQGGAQEGPQNFTALQI